VDALPRDGVRFRVPNQNILSRDGRIREAEFSITAACTLRCEHCGFYVPEQPNPHDGDAGGALGHMLSQLERIGVRIDSLALLGGEATLAPRELNHAIAAARSSPTVGRLELVTNGLTPQGLPPETARRVDRISLSDYTHDSALADAWQSWMRRFAPSVELVVRRHDTWANNLDDVDLGEAGASSVWSTCWYRRHCVTLERERIFACSRVAKRGRDTEGLRLADIRDRAELAAYLNGSEPLASCRTCSLVAGLPPVSPGRQPDGRLAVLRERTLGWFARVEGGE